MSFLYEGIYVGRSRSRGRGVYTKDALPGGMVIETAPVIVMPHKDRLLLDETLLHDYIFEWGDKRTECIMALGLVPMYNHSYQSNCDYEMDFKRQLISVKTVRDIEAGEELFINYNGEWNDERPVWFDVK